MKESLTVDITGVQFTRGELFDLVTMVTSPGWAQIERLLDSWKFECMEDLLLRAFPDGITMSDHLSLVAGRSEMLAHIAMLKATVFDAHEEMKKLEEAASQ